VKPARKAAHASGAYGSSRLIVAGEQVPRGNRNHGPNRDGLLWVPGPDNTAAVFPREN
jgi:hypothetical protein